MKSQKFSSRREYWKHLINEHARSGQTQSEFCRTRGIATGSLSSWKSILSAEKKSVPEFVRVEMAKVLEPMRIVFPSGAALHFAETPSPEWIRELMKLVS